MIANHLIHSVPIEKDSPTRKCHGTPLRVATEIEFEPKFRKFLAYLEEALVYVPKF